LASPFTPTTICRAVSVDPESMARFSVWPVARIFTCVPPMSIASTFMPHPPFRRLAAVGSARPCPPDGLLSDDVS